MLLEPLPRDQYTDSPFDQIKRADERGEYWSARDLMPLMGYTKWQAFEVPLNRAMKSAEAQGVNVEDVFTGSRKNPEGGLSLIHISEPTRPY